MKCLELAIFNVRFSEYCVTAQIDPTIYSESRIITKPLIGAARHLIKGIVKGRIKYVEEKWVNRRVIGFVNWSGGQDADHATSLLRP